MIACEAAALIIAAGLVYRIWVRSPARPRPSGPPPSDAELLQARLDIYRVQRGVDASLAGHEAHREAELTKQAIAEALKGQS